MNVYELKKWRAVSSALRSSDSGSAVARNARAPVVLEEALLLGSLDLHATILSFVDDASEDRASLVSSAWARLRGWICELPGVVRTAVFSRDGSKLAVGTEERVLAVYDVKTQRILWASANVGLNTPNVVFLHDGTMAVGRAKPWVQIYDPATGVLLRKIGSGILDEERNGSVRDHTDHLALSPDGTTLAVCHEYNMRVRLYNVATGAPLGPYLVTHESPGEIYDISFSPDGSTLAVCSLNSKLEFYDVAAGTLRHEIVRDKLYVGTSLAFSPDGTMVAACTWRDFRLYDATTFEVLHTLDLARGATCRGVMFSHDSKTVIVGHSDDKTVFYDAATLEVLREIPRTGCVISNALSPDGKLCAIAGAADPHPRYRDSSPDEDSSAVEYSSSGQYSSSSSGEDDDDSSGEDDDDSDVDGDSEATSDEEESEEENDEVHMEGSENDEEIDGSDASDAPYYVYSNEGPEPVRMGRVALYIAATGERYRMR